MITAVPNICENTNSRKAPGTAKEVISEKWVPQSRGLIGYIHVPMSPLKEKRGGMSLTYINRRWLIYRFVFAVSRENMYTYNKQM